MPRKKQIPLFPPGPFDDLAQETRDAIAGSTTDQIKARILSAVELREQNGKDKKQDQHLKEVKQTAKEAGERYTEVEKETKLIIGYGLQVLRDRGTPLEVLPEPKPAPEVDPRQQVLVTDNDPGAPVYETPGPVEAQDSARTEALRPQTDRRKRGPK